MENKTQSTDLKPLELWTIVVGFLLAGIVIAVVAVSYLLHSPFPIRVLVWVIGVAAFVLTSLATLYPARRAALVNPAAALRYE